MYHMCWQAGILIQNQGQVKPSKFFPTIFLEAHQATWRMAILPLAIPVRSGHGFPEWQQPPIAAGR
jgi:hypothetical protein